VTGEPEAIAALAVQPAVAEALNKWHAMIAAGDLGALPALLHPQVVFRSPMAFKPYAGAPLVALILSTVTKVFEDFAYHRELVGRDGLDVVLEFSAKVGERELKGIAMIRFDEQGAIVEFEVMIRPMSGLQALGDEMARRLAPLLPGKTA
jgi:hypothetical protein